MEAKRGQHPALKRFLDDTEQRRLKIIKKIPGPGETFTISNLLDVKKGEEFTDQPNTAPNKGRKEDIRERNQAK